MIFQFTKREVVKLVQATLRNYRTSSQNVDVPTITVPNKMVQQIQKAKQRQLRKKVASMKKVYKTPAIIQCHRPEFNHHKGQTYSEFNPKVLASHGWTHYKSAGDSFTIDFKEMNPSVDPENSGSSFTDLDLSDQVLLNLQKMNIENPTHIQEMVIPKILEGHNVICAAETGSGKTLAYLLPVVEIISRQIRGMEDISSVAKNAPQCVILVPTRELISQIIEVGKKLTDECDVLLSKQSSGNQDPERDRIDILVTTPGALKKMLSAGRINVSRLQHMVIDEADTMLDDSFSREVVYVIKKLGVHGGSPTGDKAYITTGLQLVLVSATLPRGLDRSIGSFLPVESFEEITTKSLHRVMPHVPQKFLRIKPSLKEVEIVKLAKQNYNNSVPTLIFCNKSETVFWLEKLLKENDVKCLIMNSKMETARRVKSFELFQNGQRDILICTDVGSRGLDTLRVSQVINFDFPSFVSDYVHRAGRVGRVGSAQNCKVVSFVTHKWEVELLWNIETAVRKSQALHNVNANIKRKLDSIVLKKYGAKDAIDL